MALKRKDFLTQFTELHLIYNYTGVEDPKRFGYVPSEWSLASINGITYSEYLLNLNIFLKELKAFNKKDILQFLDGMDLIELEHFTRELETLLKREPDLYELSESLKYSKGKYVKVGIVSSISFKNKGTKKGSEPINNIWLNQQAYKDIGEVSYILKQVAHYFLTAVEVIKSIPPTTILTPKLLSKKVTTLQPKPPYNFVSTKFTEDDVELLFDLLSDAGYLDSKDSQKRSFIAGFSNAKAKKKITPQINWLGFESHLRYLIFHHLPKIEPSYKVDKDLSKSRWCTAELLFTVKGKATTLCKGQDRGNYPSDKNMKELSEAFNNFYMKLGL